MLRHRGLQGAGLHLRASDVRTCASDVRTCASDVRTCASDVRTGAGGQSSASMSVTVADTRPTPSITCSVEPTAVCEASVTSRPWASITTA